MAKTTRARGLWHVGDINSDYFLVMLKFPFLSSPRGTYKHYYSGKMTKPCESWIEIRGVRKVWLMSVHTHRHIHPQNVPDCTRLENHRITDSHPYKFPTYNDVRYSFFTFMSVIRNSLLTHDVTRFSIKYLSPEFYTNV